MPSNADRSEVHNRRGWLAAAIAVAVVAALTLYSRSASVLILPYVALLSLGSATIFILLRRAGPPGSRFVLGVAIFVHAIALAGFAAFENDYFRFLWDGWQTVATGTPYGVVPSDYYGQELPNPGLSRALDGINNADLKTIYGPMLQLVFAAVYWLGGADPLVLRIVFAVLNLAIVALLLRVAGPKGAALYGWCPLVIAEVVIHLHPDAIMVLPLLAGLVLVRSRPLLAGIAFGMAAGVKIVALAAWPLLLRMERRAPIAAIAALVLLYLLFLVQGQGVGCESTEVFAREWYFNPLGFAALSQFLPQGAARFAAGLLGMMLILLFHARTRGLEQPPLAPIFGAVLLFAPAVNAWYMLWILPFAVASRAVWPFALVVALPLSYLTGINLDDTSLEAFQVHPLAWWTEIVLLLAALAFDARRWLRERHSAVIGSVMLPPINEPHIGVLIPAFDEEQSIGNVVAGIRAARWPRPPVIFVIDNGSSDRTAALALAAGATVIEEPRKGYGSACLAGIAALPENASIVVFLDADGSDVPAEAPALVAPIIAGKADLVIGSRILGDRQKGSMTVPQLFGNWLATRLVRLVWGGRMTDLGPFRAIRRDSLMRLDMADRDFGWTVEMQVKAVRQNMAIIEKPAAYRKRVGVSKISGTVRGVFAAGTKILWVIGREAFVR